MEAPTEATVGKLICRISNSPQNPDRPYFSCPIVIRGRKACDFFKWCDVHATEVRAQELANLVAHLQLKVKDLEAENTKLARKVKGAVPEQASSSMAGSNSVSCDGSIAEQVRELNERLGRLERFLGL